MPNIKQIISKQNKTIQRKTEPQEATDKNCNCRRSKICPLGKQCKTPKIIYQATVTRQDSQNKETYIGLSETEFKLRFNNHTHSFRHKEHRNDTALSQHIWKLKDNNKNYEIEWKIIAKSNTYSTSSKTCNLCLKEKYIIICKPHMATLNTRNELASGCRHRKRHLLSNLA